MRLINTTTLAMKEFFTRIPPYAILSHTWGREEVTYQGLQEILQRDPAVSDTAGFSKIQGLCNQARSDGLQWAWIDTCCIDKTSSAELSEAINSMFGWYRRSDVCYVYMQDVDNPISYGSTLLDVNEWSPPFRKAFHSSRWFTRGWTLQELVAPSSIDFFARDWSEIGTKRSLIEILAAKTGIRRSVLESTRNMDDASAAERMSWAAKRETSREEDMAYCLFGIFGVNMPLLYGEGRRAFIRLQYEILRTLDDYTLLAWSWKTCSPLLNDGCAMATHPSAFECLIFIINPVGPRRGQPELSDIQARVVRRPFALHVSPTKHDAGQAPTPRHGGGPQPTLSAASPSGSRAMSQLESHRLAGAGTPTPTSRGLLVTLLARLVRDGNRHGVHVLAWPFCEVAVESPPESRLVGVLLYLEHISIGVGTAKEGPLSVWDTASGGQPVAARRVNPGYLAYIPSGEVRDLVPVTMYLRTTAADGMWSVPGRIIAGGSVRRVTATLSDDIRLCAADPEFYQKAPQEYYREFYQDIFALHIRRRQNGPQSSMADFIVVCSTIKDTCYANDHPTIMDEASRIGIGQLVKSILRQAPATASDRAIFTLRDGSVYRLSMKCRIGAGRFDVRISIVCISEASPLPPGPRSEYPIAGLSA